MVAKGQGVGEGMEWEVGVSRCKLLYMEWINNKVLLDSTGNYIQYPVITIMEKNMKNSIHIYITELLCCTAEINDIVNQLYFNKIF